MKKPEMMIMWLCSAHLVNIIWQQKFSAIFLNHSRRNLNARSKSTCSEVLRKIRGISDRTSDTIIFTLIGLYYNFWMITLVVQTLLDTIVAKPGYMWKIHPCQYFYIFIWITENETLKTILQLIWRFVTLFNFPVYKFQPNIYIFKE